MFNPLVVKTSAELKVFQNIFCEFFLILLLSDLFFRNILITVPVDVASFV